jgi:hypothetical protein
LRAISTVSFSMSRTRTMCLPQLAVVDRLLDDASRPASPLDPLPDLVRQDIQAIPPVGQHDLRALNPRFPCHWDQHRYIAPGVVTVRQPIAPTVGPSPPRLKEREEAVMTALHPAYVPSPEPRCSDRLHFAVVSPTVLAFAISAVSRHPKSHTPWFLRRCQ